MIVFEGMISKECLRYIQKKEGIVGLKGCILAIFAFIIPLFLILYKFFHVPLYWIAFAGIPIVLIVTFAAYFSAFGKSTQKLIVPIQVKIYEDGTMVSKGQEFNLSQTVDDVTVVLDMGDWYHISFNGRMNLARFVCEKKLLVHGTVEEFEKIFEGKIVRKK